ncbi:hypothetical protein HWI79_3566 [Cryptosporidium felis]|nr:hypothetical protein HWI79_3566 [Cryptosporidium felis]
MENNENLNVKTRKDGDVLNEILLSLKNHGKENFRKEIIAKPGKGAGVYRSAPYLNNPLFHELLRGKENKLNDLDRQLPIHLLARSAQNRSNAPELWKKLWAERSISDVITSSNNGEKSKLEKIFISCITEDEGIATSEQYFPVSDWSYYIWWLFSRKPEISKISPKLPGHVVTAIASMEWKLLPIIRPDILNDFISSVNSYKLSNPPPCFSNKNRSQKDYFRQLMKDLRSGLQDNFSEWLLPYLRSKKIQVESFGNNSNRGNSSQYKGSEAIKDAMPVESISNLVCRDIDRSQAKKKGHANLVPTHLFPHINSSDCSLQNQLYQNVYIEEYSNTIWSIINPPPKIEIKVGTLVQFAHSPKESMDEVYWINGEIESISSDSGEIILKSRSFMELEEPISISTSLLNFLPPSIPTFEVKKKWWRLLPAEPTSKDFAKGSVIVYRSGNSNLLSDGVITEVSVDNSDKIKIRRLFDGECEEITREDILNRVPYDIHPFDEKYDINSPLSSWTWCIPRQFQGDNGKGVKGKFLLWLVSAEINMINDDPLLCVSIQPDIPFNYGYIWGPLPITCFIDIRNSNIGDSEHSWNLQDVDSILDTPLNLLV